MSIASIARAKKRIMIFLTLFMFYTCLSVESNVYAIGPSLRIATVLFLHSGGHFLKLNFRPGHDTTEWGYLQT